MAREKSTLNLPITVTFRPTARSKKIKKKTMKNRTIDDVMEGIGNGSLPGIPEEADIMHVGVGSSFI